jgi:uncharacterized membrane protein
MIKFRFEKKHIPLTILVVFGLLLFFMGIANHYFFRTVTFDYGNYNFAFRDYAHFRISPMPTYPGNFLQDHLSFTLMFLAPLYWLLNWLTGTYTLIIIQYTLIMVGAWYSYKLISLKTNGLWITSGVLVYYFVLLGRYTTFSCDVNLAVISACLIPVFLYAFEKKKYGIAGIIMIFALLSRENIPLWFIFIFMALIIGHRKDKKAVLFSVAGIVISILYFIILFKILIPAVETEEKHFTLFNYAALGKDPGEALRFVITHPVRTFQLFFVNHLNDPAFNGVKAEFYLVYLISGGFVLLLRPQYLIWFIPVVAQKVLNDYPVRWGISTYYSIEVVTLLPISVFLVLASLRTKWLRMTLPVLVCVVTVYTTLYKLNPDHVKIPWTMNPAKERIFKKAFFQTPYHIRETNRIIKMIPEKVMVSASDHFFPHLSQRDSICLFPKVENARYILFSVFDNNFQYTHQENEQMRNAFLNSKEWEVVAEEFPVFLLIKKGVKTSDGPIKLSNEFRTDTLRCDYELRDSVREILLFNDSSLAENASRVTNTVSRSGKHSLKLDAGNPYSRTIEFPDAARLENITVNVYYQSKNDHSNIVATTGKDFYILNGIPGETDKDGWKKLELSFWVPQYPESAQLILNLWNTGNEPSYFDDLEIIKRYRKEEKTDQ